MVITDQLVEKYSAGSRESLDRLDCFANDCFRSDM